MRDERLAGDDHAVKPQSLFPIGVHGKIGDDADRFRARAVPFLGDVKDPCGKGVRADDHVGIVFVDDTLEFFGKRASRKTNERAPIGIAAAAFKHAVNGAVAVLQVGGYQKISAGNCMIHHPSCGAVGIDDLGLCTHFF